jgi:hypothetical protein
MRYFLERWMWTGLRRGFTTGSRWWLYIGASAGTANFLIRFLRRPPADVYRVRLHEGGAFRVQARRR